MKIAKDKSLWNSGWTPKAKRGGASTLPSEEWMALEKDDFHLPFLSLISATVTALCPQWTTVCCALETASHLICQWQWGCSSCTHWWWVQAGILRADTASSAQEQLCWRWWPCCTQRSLKTVTHGANPPALPPSAVSPITGGGVRPPRTALPAKAFIDLGPGPKRVKVLPAFCKLYSRPSNGIAWSCESLVLPTARHPRFSLQSLRAEGVLAPRPHLHRRPALPVQDGLAPGRIPAVCKRCESPLMKWFFFPPFFWMRRLQERNLEISSPFPKAFIKTAHKSSLWKL